MAEIPWPPGVPKPLSCPAFTDAPSDGPKVARWIERNCVYTSGPKFGQPVKLEVFQRIFLIWLFEKRPDGRYRYRRALLECPKGQGKTPLASWIGAYQLANQYAAVIPVAAASLEQAELLFGDMRQCVSESKTLSRVMMPFEHEIQVKDGPGRAYKVAAVAGTNDGQRPSTLLGDEIHEWVGSRERVHLVLANGCSKRQDSLIVNTTTPGFDPNTLAGRMHDYGLRVNSGEIDDPEFLFVWWGCPADRYDLTDEEQRQQAIRDASPAADLFADVRDISNRYHQIPENEWLRYYLACWVSGVQAWLPLGAWDGCKDTTQDIPDGADVCLGFDGSFNNDATALVVAACGETPHLDVVELWEKPPTAGPDWKVPIADVEETIRQACRRWQVREIVCDPARWARSYQILEDEGLPIVAFPQNAGHMIPATQRMYEAVVNRMITHSGDARLARHIGNAMAKTDARGTRICKASPNSPLKVDLAVAAVMALDRAAVAPPSYDVLDSFPA
ncbi:terminase TerL endonuclease subunit [Mycobacterium avium]|uniref:terminase TerL endonuclease subunit n=1 Tax=Mycobacterium avium TaxID=1764 RepID=UPI0026666913|nr:terminase TerL endonuclease subunit [Mycobacterium avium]MDO2354666.1 terminase large subunit [Mycobacterium avium subsp. hominissuis]